MTEKFPIVVKTLASLEEILADELKLLGGENIDKAFRVVTLEGNQQLLYKINLQSRFALRVLKPIKKFPAASEQQLYDEIKKISWSDFLSADDTLAIDSVVTQSKMTHSLYVSQKAKDAIVDQMRDNTGKRPNVDINNPSLRIHLHINKDEAEISFDSSGSSLHRRGYRQQQVEAPLAETLAAGMIALSMWDRNSPFTDLMCGSGTIVIESAMMARNIAPGLLRREFGFQRWKDFNSEMWNALVEEAKLQSKDKLDFPIIGIDKSYEAVRIAELNARTAGVQNEISFYAMPFEDYTPKENSGTIITNPPYGGRITDEDLFVLYKNIGDSLKKKFQGWNAWILTANKEAAAKIGLKASRRIPLFNGPLECRMLKYELYGGTKRIKPE